jgi:hypothetical protein
MPKTTKKESAIQTFFKENKSLAIMLPVLVVLIIAMIIIYSGNGDAGKAEPISSDIAASPTPGVGASSGVGAVPIDQPKVEVLPQVVRKTASQGDIASTNDPFEEPMKLSGILTNSRGEAIAIIELAGTSCIVRPDDNIGDTPWKVVSIYESSVMLDFNGESLLLKLETNP